MVLARAANSATVQARGASSVMVQENTVRNAILLATASSVTVLEIAIRVTVRKRELAISVMEVAIVRVATEQEGCLYMAGRAPHVAVLEIAQNAMVKGKSDVTVAMRLAGVAIVKGAVENVLLVVAMLTATSVAALETVNCVVVMATVPTVRTVTESV